MGIFEDGKTYTEKEWYARGEKLFGKDRMLWRFKCPACEKTQSARDLEPLKEKGATPDGAYQSCKGRFTGGKNGPDKCDWAAYGLFAGPCFVIAEDDGKKIPVFNFAEPEEGKESQDV